MKDINVHLDYTVRLSVTDEEAEKATTQMDDKTIESLVERAKVVIDWPGQPEVEGKVIFSDASVEVVS